MRWEIRHRTHYRYAAPVQDSFNEVRLKPVTNEHQRLEEFSLTVRPVTAIRDYPDFYGNSVGHFELLEPHQSLEVESRAVVSTFPSAPMAPDAELAPMDGIAEAGRTERCYDYVLPSKFVDADPQTWRLAVDAAGKLSDVWQVSMAIMEFVHSHIEYVPQSTQVHTHLAEVLAQRQGVCQDFAHVMIGLCRSLKIPALYVSGYLASESANATHAWVEVFIPGAGWRALDPTHNRQPDERYVKIAVGRDYADVRPVSGAYRGACDWTMEVEVKIAPL